MSKFFQFLKSILGVKGVSKAEQEKELIKAINSSGLFRSLTGKELEAVTIMDNRKLLQDEQENGKINNDVLVICDHATSDLKMTKLEDWEMKKVQSWEGVDVNAAMMANAISENLQCLAVMSNFCKLFIDPSVPITSSNLIKRVYHQPAPTSSHESVNPPQEVTLNSSSFNLEERLDTFYLDYQKLLKESMEFIDPKVILSIHTHDPQHSSNQEAILYHPYPYEKKFLEALDEQLKDRSIWTDVRKQLRINDEHLCSPFNFDNLICFYEGKVLDGAHISINSERLEDPDFAMKVLEAINKAYEATKDSSL